MKLEQFKEKKKKKKIIIGSVTIIVLLLTVTILIRTFAIYKEANEFSVIKGMVPDQFYDTMFAFYQMDESGNKTPINTIPAGKNWDVSVTCNKGAVGVWNTTSWGPNISNLTETRTKCKITFETKKPLLADIVKQTVVTSGVGVYEVTHNDAVIGTHMNSTQTANLKMTEYRYAGKNPNNFVTFNNELWRIIGLVNTPEGQRVKLIRNESIGEYSWDSSASTINSGWGVNEWSQSDMMTLLNNGTYFNRTTGTCYSGTNNGTKPCDFSNTGSNTGITNESKKMMESVTWNAGTNGTDGYNTTSNGLVNHFYNYERSNNNGKICTSGDYCNDTVIRTTTWKGLIGLINPTDYGYASSGGSTTNRDSCLTKELYGWNNATVSDCKNNDWLYTSTNQWTMIPLDNASNANNVFQVSLAGFVVSSGASNANSSRPSFYLQSNIKVIAGNGTENTPYQLGV